MQIKKLILFVLILYFLNSSKPNCEEEKLGSKVPRKRHITIQEVISYKLLDQTNTWSSANSHINKHTLRQSLSCTSRKQEKLWRRSFQVGRNLTSSHCESISASTQMQGDICKLSQNIFSICTPNVIITIHYSWWMTQIKNLIHPNNIRLSPSWSLIYLNHSVPISHSPNSNQDLHLPSPTNGHSRYLSPRHCPVP